MTDTRVLVVAGSVGLHAIAVLGISQCELPTIERPPTTDEPISAVEVAIAIEPLVGVELVTLPPTLDPATFESPPIVLAPSGSKGRVPRVRGGAADAVAAGESLRMRGDVRSNATVAGEPAAAVPGESLRMRGRRHDLQLAGDVIDRLIAGSAPPLPITIDGRLRPSGGEHAIHDEVTTLRVERDGTAHLHDQKDFDGHIVLPIKTFDQLRRGFGEHLTTWRDDPYRDQRAGRIQDLPRHLSAAPGACESWGDPLCEPSSDRPIKSLSGDGLVIPGISGKADLTGWLHRKFIGDPYASRKLELLDTTRDARAQIGATHRSAQRARAAELAQRNLVALWQATSDPAQRKAALFALWDECAETEDADGEAGARARAIVLGWIRAKLPVGSRHAFTADEIARLDAARTSRQHFVPY